MISEKAVWPEGDPVVRPTADEPKGFHGAHHLPVPVADHAGVDQHGQAGPALVHHAHILVKTGNAAFQRQAQRAFALADIRPEDIPAVAAQDLLPGKAGQFFGRLVEGGNLPADVDGKDPLGQMFEEAFVHGGGPERLAGKGVEGVPDQEGKKSGVPNADDHPGCQVIGAHQGD